MNNPCQLVADFGSFPAPYAMDTLEEPPQLLQFWESEKTKPKVEGVSPEATLALVDTYHRSFHYLLQRPFQSLEETRAAQFDRIQDLVDIAFTSIPVYT